jgi:hypothetical protein
LVAAVARRCVHGDGAALVGGIGGGVVASALAMDAGGTSRHIRPCRRPPCARQASGLQLSGRTLAGTRS